MNQRKLNDIELIADFMELPIKFGNWRVAGEQQIFFKLGKLWLDTPHLEYHKSWDWLMPACQKFCSLLSESDFKNYDMKCFANSTRGVIERAIWDYMYMRGSIEQVCSELSKAISWYNETRKFNLTQKP